MTKLVVSGGELIGRTLVEILPMSDEEAEAVFGDSWRAPTVLVFDDGSRVFASRDEEGNGGGVLFGQVEGVDIVVAAWEEQ